MNDEMAYRAAKIMGENGFTDARAKALRRFPMARSQAEADALYEEWNKPKPHWSETAAPDDPRWEMLRKSRIASGMTPNTTDTAE